MAVLREAWESGKSQDVSVVAHVVQIREQLQQMTDLVGRRRKLTKRSGMIGMPEVANLSQETKYLCCYLRQPASCLHSGRVHMK